MTAIAHRSYAHYHSSFMYDLARVGAQSGRGVACVIASVAAIEALLGDIMLTYLERRNLIESLRNESPVRDGFLRSKRSIPTFSNVPPLTELEVFIAVTIEKHTKKGIPALKQYYLLQWLLQGKTLELNEIDSNVLREAFSGGTFELFQLRNSIVHRHGTALLLGDDGTLTDSPTGLPKSVIAIKDIVKLSDVQPLSGWLGLVDTKEVALWSLSVARQFINKTLDCLPQADASTYLKDNARI